MPALRPVTTPDVELTVAVRVLLELNVTVLLEVLVGNTVDANAKVAPTRIIGITLTLDAYTERPRTVTPTGVVTSELLMFAVPSATAVTSPDALTRATLLLDEVHVLAGGVELLETTSVSCCGVVFVSNKLVGRME